MGCLKMNGIKHVWIVCQGPTTLNFPNDPWQRVYCANCGIERIEQPPVTRKAEGGK